MKINDKILLPLILLVAILVGIGATVLYSNYADDVKRSFLNDKEEEDNTIYFPPSHYAFREGDSEQWLFRVIQVKVLEYKNEGGLHYIIGEYRPFNSDDWMMVKVKILLTREDEWNNSFEGLNSEDFEKVISDKVVSQKTFDLTTINFWEREDLDLENLKKTFEVGDIIALSIPYDYPTYEEGTLTEELCRANERACNFTPVWDHLMTKSVDFWGGLDLSSEEEFFLVPYTISTDIFTQNDLKSFTE